MAVKELTSYKKNIKDFIKELKGKVITRINFFEEEDPQFDLKKAPFKFFYTFTLVIETESDNYWMHTSSTSTGVESLWMEKNKEVIDPSRVEDINEKVVSIESFEGFDDFSYKMVIKTENQEWTFYAAEIYKSKSGDGLDYSQNDEMILAFNDPAEAEKFEKFL